MKLSIINGWEDGHFAAVKAKGLSAVEFCINGKINSAEVLAIKEQIKASSEKYGVEVASIGRWGMDRLDCEGNIIPEAVQHDKNLIDLASFLGCPVFNAGCNRVEGMDYYDNCRAAVRYLGGLIDYAKDKNVKIAVYNCDWCNFIWCEKAWSFVLGQLPELGIKYDPSHCVHRGGDPYKEVLDWGERIYHFHLKGTQMVAGESVDDPPAGLDDLNWRKMISLLYRANYDGALSIEPHSHHWRGAKGQWGIDFTVNYMKQFIMPDDYASDDNPYMP